MSREELLTLALAVAANLDFKDETYLKVIIDKLLDTCYKYRGERRYYGFKDIFEDYVKDCIQDQIECSNFGEDD